MMSSPEEVVQARDPAVADQQQGVPERLVLAVESGEDLQERVATLSTHERVGDGGGDDA